MERTGEVLEIENLAVPNDDERLAFARRGIEDAAVIGGGHGNFAVRQKLRRLRAGFPPDDIFFDLVELLEGPLDTGIGGQNLVDFRRRNAGRPDLIAQSERIAAVLNRIETPMNVMA